MLKHIDGVKKVYRQLVERPAAESDFLLARGARQLSKTLAGMLNTDAQRQRRELRRANSISRREEALRREQERAERVEAERRARSEKIWQSAVEAKAIEQDRKRRRERLQRARAKLQAERLSLKLQKRAQQASGGSAVMEKRLFVWQWRRGALVRMVAGVGRGVYASARGLRYLARYVLIAAAAAAGIALVLAWLVYGRFAPAGLAELLRYNLPFPALMVDYRPVSYANYRSEERLLGAYYAARYRREHTQTPLGDAQPSEVDLVFSQVVSNSILRRLQRHYNISVSADEEAAAFQQIAAVDGGEEKFTEVLYNEYGLTKGLFIERVAFYDALKSKLAAAFSADSAVHRNARLRMENVIKLVHKGTQTFEELAQGYSEDNHALKGGDIGYVKTAGMPGQLRAAVDKLDAGMVSGLLQEQGRYYIVKVYDRKQTKENGEEVWLKQISILTNYTFDDYLVDLKNKAKVWDLTD